MKTVPLTKPNIMFEQRVTSINCAVTWGEPQANFSIIQFVADGLGLFLGPSQRVSGRGGIGRRAGFRFQCLRDVRVQVPSPAPFGEEGFAVQLSRRTVLAGLASLGLTPFITPASAAASDTTDTPDIFRIGVPARAITADPSVTSDIESHRLSRQFYQNLIGVDPETGETIAELATDCTLRDDG